jgi:uncharacterized damage-inducible protein DinB
MTIDLQVQLGTLLAYTDWERELWRAWFLKEGPSALSIPVGPYGDGRMTTVGELVRHIFTAEQRYVERMLGQPLTEQGSIPADDPSALFTFAASSRARFRDFVATCPAGTWDIPQQMSLLGKTVSLTPRKVVIHCVLHEIRHWGQVATLLRLSGKTAGMQDFLFSPVDPGALKEAG